MKSEEHSHPHEHGHEHDPGEARGKRGPRGPRGPRPEWLIADRRPKTTTEADRGEIRAWFIGNLADGWFTGEADITIDDYEILVIGTLTPLDAENLDESGKATALSARIERFRNDTREKRMAIASDAQTRFGRKVSWGAHINDATMLFTTASVPVMTRLRIDQRRTLDTLVEANVARSRSEALAWCVDLVSRHEDDWISSLRSALDAVTEARENGPNSDAS